MNFVKTLIKFAFVLLYCQLSYAQENGRLGVLPQPEETLQKRIQFWVRIYSEYTTAQNIIHDAKYPDLIFEIFDTTEIQNDYNLTPKFKEKKIKKKLKELKEFYTKTLLSIHRKLKTKEPFNDVEQKVFNLYKDIDEPNKFFNAAHSKRVRQQLGQKDRFLQGLFYSGRYIPAMEKIFANYGLPVEITRLPFVESSFNIGARSKVGASGIWQFMRSTGKLYLKINDIVDERNDPLRAAEAAARLLKLNFESLNQWPLAITAYNHGRKGVMRASSKIGTESLTEIIENYKSRSFGFASSNFYCEFMAALEVERNAEKYFGKFERDQGIEFAEIVLNDFVNINDLSTYTRVSMDDLIELNPSLSEKVVKGKLLVPAGFPLRIPSAMRDKFLVAYNQMPTTKKFASQKNFLRDNFKNKF